MISINCGAVYGSKLTRVNPEINATKRKRVSVWNEEGTNSALDFVREHVGEVHCVCDGDNDETGVGEGRPIEEIVQDCLLCQDELV